MSAAIDFYFDFALPYGYIMSQHIDAIAARHGHEVVWRAMLLGPAFKVSGAVPVLGMPVKGEVRLQHRAAEGTEITEVSFDCEAMTSSVETSGTARTIL